MMEDATGVRGICLGQQEEQVCCKKERGLRGGVLCVKGVERGGGFERVDESQILCLLCEKCSIWME